MFLPASIMSADRSPISSSGRICATASVSPPIGISPLIEEKPATRNSYAACLELDPAVSFPQDIQLIRTGNPDATLITIETPAGTKAFTYGAISRSNRSVLFRGPGEHTLFFIHSAAADSTAIVGKNVVVVSIAQIDN